MKKLTLNLVRFYQHFLSPNRFGIYCCRYTPSCSEYVYDSVSKFGVIRGGFLGFGRILKCNPLSKGGFDPVKE